MRHVGLTESVAMIADALGWKLDAITDEIEPKIAAKTVSSQFLTVKKGQVCGIIQDGVGYRMARRSSRCTWRPISGAPESYDAVRIEGSPALDMKHRRRRAWRRRDGLDHRQLDPESDRRAGRPAHDAQPADPVLLLETGGR